MSADDETRALVREYIRTHPEAETVGEVVGALSPDVTPAEADLVADVLDVEAPDTTTPNDATQTRGREDTAIQPNGWQQADSANPNANVWPVELLEREQWMGHVGKQPFAPWGDRDHPEADPDDDARWKWGLTENYVDGETVALAEEDPRLDGRAFLQQPDDPYAYVDGDDVRCPETGCVHPAFIEILDQLGLTYADVSQSGSGVHAMYRGELPEGVKQAAWQLDNEPYGENDDLPSIEIYAGKRVCVATGQHIPGTARDVNPWDDEALNDVLERNDQLPDRTPDVFASDRDDYDLADHEPEATTSDETTDDIRDVFAALDRIDACRVAGDTIVSAWNDDASTSEGKRAFDPIWGGASNGTANVVDERIWQDTGDRGGYGGPVVMALIDAGELDETATPHDASGRLFFRGLEHLRHLGYDIPELETSDRDDADPVSALPLERLDALDTDDARRYARKHGVEWPTTSEARGQLRDRILTAVRHQEDVVLDAPTALGKSYTVATEPWLRHADVTDESPVIQFAETREARDQSFQASQEAGVDAVRLLGRSEACPVAVGRCDPAEDDEDDPDVVITLGGTPASEWFSAVCDGRGVPFSVAHRYLAENNDQDVDLPCEHGDDDEPSTCRAIAQWDGLPRDDEGRAAVDVIHATHQFAHVPSLRSGTNMIFDERPSFGADLPHDRVRRAITAYLRDAGGPVGTFEGMVTRARRDRDDRTPNEHAEYEWMSDALEHQPDRQWYLEESDAHTLAPALAKAVWYALDGEEADANERYAATVPHEPPRLDAEANDDEGWNREWVSVVVDGDNEIRNVRAAPDLTTARCVIGLDAHPCIPLWQRNTKPSIKAEPVLGMEERALWRRYERGLLVVQVGDATRPLASGEYFDEDGTGALLEHLHDKYGDRFQTTITASSVETRTKQLMEDAGVSAPETMHFGEEKSRNDFADEDVGLVNGSIDPGDDYVLDLLAEYEADATPATTTDPDGEHRRAHGREFDGPDAEIAEALLASVREQHVAQAAGRYARNADDEDDRAVVFVRTNATPTGFVDLQVPGVEWVATDAQRDVIQALRDSESATAAELAEAADVTKEHARQTLQRLRRNGSVAVSEEAGEHGAHLYRALAGLSVRGLVEVDKTTNGDVWGLYTWSLAVFRQATHTTDSRTTSVGGGTQTDHSAQRNYRKRPTSTDT